MHNFLSCLFSRSTLIVLSLVSPRTEMFFFLAFSPCSKAFEFFTLHTARADLERGKVIEIRFFKNHPGARDFPHMHFSFNTTQPLLFIPGFDFSTGSQEGQIVPIDVTGTKKLCLLLRRKTLFGNEEERKVCMRLFRIFSRGFWAPKPVAENAISKHSDCNPRGASVFAL